jgi:hypothetical protein
MNIKQAKEALKHCFAAGLTPHFIGKHGVGKSSIVYQWASENGYEVAEIRVGQMADAGDLIGLQEFIKNAKTGNSESTKHILPDWFMKATRPGAKVIIFIDELNRGHKDLLQAIFELVYDRSLKGTKIGADCHVVAASNPPTGDYSVLDFDDSAFQDRFVHIKFEPTVEEFTTYIRAKAPTSAVGDFISEYVPMLENSNLESFDLKFVKPSRRSWDRIAMLEAVKTPAELELELFMGIVGLEPALAYTKYRETNFKSIKAEKVLNDYKSVRKDLQAAVKKGRTDMLGTLNEELDQLFKTMDKLTMDQANNLADLAHDLPAEHAYALGILVKNNQQCTMKIENFDKAKMIGTGDALGMFHHKRFVDRVASIKSKRDEMKKEETTERA